ncbi:FecR family protein [Puia dinghuensis]|uniref:DUF4974 domain-containing protein n=1 Tax=Puia dinghuensis TaxID=1792502 RepID=A0A8J2XT07_9BACT|nr:FecR domain-containing protein [Puia dinghuensis]GGB00042.1 hypothetical protein GCM10011511_24200 [Puia dinghuensis]
MQITEALIRKFFEDACTPTEADAVAAYLKENPAELKKYLSADWEEASTLPHHDQPVVLPRRYSVRWTVAVAAAALVIVAGLAILRPRTDHRQPVVAARSIPAPAQPDTAWTVRTNSTASKQLVKLDDGSVITLYANAIIRYRGRQISLHGQAAFDVTKAPGQPFIVSAGATTTTVLGTRFNVAENEKGVIVRLYQGKVSVRAAAKEYILSPGQQVSYNLMHDQSVVSTFGDATPGPLAVAPTAPAAQKLSFDNTPLPDVMTRLIQRYHTPIGFDKAAISKMYFSGTVLSTDSLSTILHVIANMNGLTVTTGKQGFILSVSPN